MEVLSSVKNPLEIPEILTIIIGHLDLNTLKNARKVNNDWNISAIPFFAKLAPPVNFYLNPENEGMQETMLEGFSLLLCNKIEVHIIPHTVSKIRASDELPLSSLPENLSYRKKDMMKKQKYLENKLQYFKQQIATYDQANDIEGQKKVFFSFTEKLGRFLMEHGNGIKGLALHQNCNMMEIEAISQQLEIKKQTSFGNILKLTPNLISLSYDFELTSVSNFKPMLLIKSKEFRLLSLKELKIKIKLINLDIQEDDHYNKLRFWAKRLFNMCPNVKKLAFEEGNDLNVTFILLKIIQKHKDLLPKLSHLVIEVPIEQKNRESRGLLNVLKNLERPIKFLELTDYKHVELDTRIVMRFEEMISAHADSLETLSLCLIVEEKFEDDVSTLKLPILPKLRKLFVNYKTASLGYIKQDYDNQNEIIPKSASNRLLESQILYMQEFTTIFERWKIVRRNFDNLKLSKLLKASNLALKFPELDTLGVTYDCGFKKQVYNCILPKDEVLSQIKNLIVNYPEEGTPLYTEWINRLEKMFPNARIGKK